MHAAKCLMTEIIKKKMEQEAIQAHKSVTHVTALKTTHSRIYTESLRQTDIYALRDESNEKGQKTRE